ncbi:MAG TPA: tetratricopeptide repeat protein [Candidatus Aminicenantes bacterium]|nr:tetratricopeptide repeat protein [Candidatus Aminicenantes bacterium]
MASQRRKASPKRRSGETGPPPAGPARRRPSPLLVIAAALVVLGLLAFALLVRPGRGGIDLAAAASHNVLLVTLDTTRADRLGCYGYPAARTPRLDALAAGGVRFARAYAPAPLTLPSHASIMSGLQPVAHGVRNNGHDLPAGIGTLATILKAKGFATAAFVSSFSVDSRFGLDRGFDVYDDTFDADQPLKGANAERRAERTFARFSAWLDGLGPKRFFAWVHYYDPHLPYDPPPAFRQGHPYDGEIAYMDHYVGAVVDLLEERGLLAKTLIVAAGDHGEGLGDKDEEGHGVFLYEETLRVPLILHDRAVFRRPGVVDSAVRLVDVAPTVLETIGLGREAAAMQGTSLVPWVRGRNAGDLDALVETFYPRENFGWSELVGLVSGRWKLIQSPRPELFDLAADPGERTNLYAEAAAEAEELGKKLEREILRSGPAPGAAAGASPARAGDRERLRSLGYVNLAPARPGEAAPDPKDRIGLLRLVQKAQRLESEGDFGAAERAHLEVLAELPDSPEAYVNLALVQARQKAFDRAVATLARGVARLPDSEALQVRLGHTYLVSGRPGEALAAMDKALALNPRNIDALTVRAGILDASGRKEEARQAYERALEAEPESRFLRMSLAANLGSTGRFEEAAAAYEGLIADFPDEQGFYQYAGIAYSYLGRYDQAIARLRQAVAIRPTPTGVFNLAVAYGKGGRLKEAAETFALYLRNSEGEKEEDVRRARAELERLKKLLGASPSR